MFAGLTELTEVNLNENSLTELTAGLFPGLAALRVLVLEGNALDGLGLSDNVFEPLTDLSTLWLQDNPGAPFVPTEVALPDDGRVPVAGGAVTLDGSTSGGAWGTNVTYVWALTTPTSGVTFDDNTSAMPVVTISGTGTTLTLMELMPTQATRCRCRRRTARRRAHGRRRGAAGSAPPPPHRASRCSDNDTAQVTWSLGGTGQGAAGGELDGGGQRHGLQGAVEVGQRELRRQPAGHGHSGFEYAPHDRRPRQRYRIHGPRDRRPDGRQRRPAVGGGDGHARGRPPPTRGR